jgi:hypothetical protein
MEKAGKTLLAFMIVDRNLHGVREGFNGGYQKSNNNILE